MCELGSGVMFLPPAHAAGLGCSPVAIGPAIPAQEGMSHDLMDSFPLGVKSEH